MDIDSSRMTFKPWDLFFKGHGYLLKPSKDKSKLLPDFGELSFEPRGKNILKLYYPTTKDQPMWINSINDIMI